MSHCLKLCPLHAADGINILYDLAIYHRHSKPLGTFDVVGFSTELWM
jgi:hypothetical protein